MLQIGVPFAALLTVQTQGQQTFSRNSQIVNIWVSVGRLVFAAIALLHGSPGLRTTRK